MALLLGIDTSTTATRQLVVPEPPREPSPDHSDAGYERFRRLYPMLEPSFPS
ncbi:MAG: hypothetical protein AAF170_06565 [Bacteroidota bacterium]